MKHLDFPVIIASKDFEPINPKQKPERKDIPEKNVFSNERIMMGETTVSQKMYWLRFNKFTKTNSFINSFLAKCF